MKRLRIILTLLLAVSVVPSQADVINIGVIQETKDSVPAHQDLKGYVIRYDIAKTGRSGLLFKAFSLESETTEWTKQGISFGQVLSFGTPYTPKGASQNRRPFSLDFSIVFSNYKNAAEDAGSYIDEDGYVEDGSGEGFDLELGLGWVIGRAKLSVGTSLQGTSYGMIGIGF